MREPKARRIWRALTVVAFIVEISVVLMGNQIGKPHVDYNQDLTPAMLQQRWKATSGESDPALALSCGRARTVDTAMFTPTCSDGIHLSGVDVTVPATEPGVFLEGFVNALPLTADDRKVLSADTLSEGDSEPISVAADISNGGAIPSEVKAISLAASDFNRTPPFFSFAIERDKFEPTKVNGVPRGFAWMVDNKPFGSAFENYWLHGGWGLFIGALSSIPLFLTTFVIAVPLPRILRRKDGSRKAEADKHSVTTDQPASRSRRGSPRRSVKPNLTRCGPCTAVTRSAFRAGTAHIFTPCDFEKVNASTHQRR